MQTMVCRSQRGGLVLKALADQHTQPVLYSLLMLKSHFYNQGPDFQKIFGQT